MAASSGGNKKPTITKAKEIVKANGKRRASHLDAPSSNKTGNSQNHSKLRKSDSTTSINSMASDASGIISEGCSQVQANTGSSSKTGGGPDQNISARIDLSADSQMSKYADLARDVLISSRDSRVLTKLNPFKIANEMDSLCGQVAKVQYLRSGSILVTTTTSQQTDQLLKHTRLKQSNIPIKVTIAWNKQFSYGKIYAPEFQSDSLDYLLEILQPNHVVGIRKLFSDPKMSHISLGLDIPGKVLPR